MEEEHSKESGKPHKIRLRDSENITLYKEASNFMELTKFEKVRDGKYLKNYELTYRNKAGREKKYEMVSRRELAGIEDVGGKPSGVSIVATYGDRMLLLHEFRMGVNRTIYNLCAGMLEPGESIEECVARELYEETGLKVRKIKKILPPSFAAVAISDTTTYIAFVEAEGDFEDHTSENEQIEARFYTKEEIKQLLETESFSSRAQMAAYFFAEG
jgi:ADP-ribose pyrophosphatase